MNATSLFDLSGRVALVTGASSGLGRRFALALAENGAWVALAARREDRLREVAREVERRGGRSLVVPLDLAKPAELAPAFDRIAASLGAPSVIVNNAGVVHARAAIDIRPEDWRRTLDIDLDAVFRVSQEAARRMVAAGSGGSIVNIASVLGFGVSKGTSAYSVAKAGVVQLTRALALEWARHGIRVNAIAPGWFRTEINDDYLASPAGEDIRKRNPLRRFGEEGDLDGVLLLLASEAGRYMTGATVVVDGGQSLAVS